MSLGAAKVAYALLGALAIVAVTYLFGHPILELEIAGNDSAYALSIISWISEWFPRIPLWYPLQGGGSSSIVQYSYGSHWIVAAASHLTGLSIFEVFRIAQLSSIALTALGVYALVWVKMRSLTMALLSGLAYPISAAAWPWVIDIGLFGQAVSLVFFCPAFILFDWYIQRPGQVTDLRHSRRRPYGLAAVSVSFFLIFMTHGATALVFGMTILVYAALLPLLDKGRVNLVRNAAGSVARASHGLILGAALAGFWLIPYLHLSQLANREGVAGEFALHQIPFLSLTAILGLSEPPLLWRMWSMSFASAVVFMAGVGLLISIVRRDVAVLWGVLAVAFALFSAMPGIWLDLVAVFQKLWGLVYIRAIIPTMIFLPALAGYGAYRTAALIVALPPRLFARLSLGAGRNLTAITGVAVTLLSFAIAYLAFVHLRLSPVGDPNYPGYGATAGSIYWPVEFEGENPIWARPPKFALNESASFPQSETARLIVNELELDSNSRIDVSPFLGGLLQVLPLHSRASTINLYFYLGSLIHSMWGYQQGAFFGDEFGTANEINELSKWFGIEYVAISETLDPLWKFDEAGWPLAYATGPEESRIQVRQSPFQTALASMIQRPSMLVIGGYENDAYGQVFKLVAQGMLAYEDAIIVEGTHRVDDYSLEQLQEFDALLLYGYGYADKEAAWGLVERYVLGGGSLFVDTGWQYFSPDWDMGQTPNVLPIAKLEWTNFGTSSDYQINSGVVSTAVDSAEFSPLIWEDVAWSVSSSASSNIRDWGTTLLSVSGNPLVAAGEYGDGRVVWSGMNLVGHISTYENDQERQFVHDTLLWLLANQQQSTEIAVPFDRADPDRVEITIPGPIETPTYLMWREAYSPDWRASVQLNGKSRSIDIHRAGPGMMLLRIPESNDDYLTIQMRYGFGALGLVGLGVSAAALAAVAYGTYRSMQTRPIHLGRERDAGSMGKGKKQTADDVASIESFWEYQ